MGEAANGLEAADLAVRLRPDVVLMDVRMPGPDGIEATRRVVSETGSRVLTLTTFDLDEYAFDGLRAGASGFLLKDVLPTALDDAIRAVAGGDALTPRITHDLVDRFAREPTPVHLIGAESTSALSRREREVFDLVATGMTNAEIASHRGDGENAHHPGAEQAATARSGPGRDLRLRTRAALTAAPRPAMLIGSLPHSALDAGDRAVRSNVTAGSSRSAIDQRLHKFRLTRRAWSRARRPRRRMQLIGIPT